MYKLIKIAFLKSNKYTKKRFSRDIKYLLEA